MSVAPTIEDCMPASETPTNPPNSRRVPGPVSSSDAPVAVEESLAEDTLHEALAAPENEGVERPGRGYSTSRYVDYDAHELLERISQYEDERRWQRIREGIWISIILHILFFSALTWIPKYVFHAPEVIDPIQAIRDRKDLHYLDELPDALKQIQKAKPKLPPLKTNNEQVDKKTLAALKALAEAEARAQAKAQPKPAPAPEPEVAKETPPPAPASPPAPLPPSVAAPQPTPQIALETPRPAPVPARPSFALSQQSPADQLRDAMRRSAQVQNGAGISGPSLNQHSGAAGGAEILSDTQGVDFGPYMQKVIRETYRAWDPLIPEEVNPPILKRGECEIVFSILPNGRVGPGTMIQTGRSGDVALDRAAWGAIVGADYPPLPRDFHGPYLQLRFRFQYNVR